MRPRIPFVDLAAHHAPLRTEIDAAVARIVDGGRFILSDAVDAFEDMAARYFGVAHAIGVGCGLDALTLSLEAAGIGAGDDVIVPANTFVATALAVSHAGARPVLADCDAHTLTIDPAAVERAITPRTRAILPVHLYGQAADMTAVLAIAQRHGLVVIEDAAQAHGARWQDRRCGTLGLAGCFSFFPSKNLGAFGDGGLVVTNDAQIAAKIRSLRDYGRTAAHVHAVKGRNSRLDAIQAAVLSVKLPHLDRWNEQRRQHATRYTGQLAGSGVSLPALDPRGEHVHHLFVVRSTARDDLRARLGARGIETGIHYPHPIHLTDAYRDLGYREGDFPEAERASREVLSLPIYPELPLAHIDEIADAVHQCRADIHASSAAGR
jgi:dTDP-4-amino-4,6-dideoxygalactose transaminase